MAIQRRVSLAFRPRSDDEIHAFSEHYGSRDLILHGDIRHGPPGDWSNYIKAAMQAAARVGILKRGIDAAVTSDLPPAAGLSSSSALLTAFTVALLAANGVQPSLEQLMDVLPEGEQFVGTRGGAMDHAAVLGAEAGCALLVHFQPFSLAAIPIPEGWSFLVAHSLTTAEKSGAVRALYNARRMSGASALQKVRYSLELTQDERRCLLHVEGEAARVKEAVAALNANDPVRFGQLLIASHASLRDNLQVSCSALDELVEAALDAGALGARLTGAGFGGCTIILTRTSECSRVASRLVQSFYEKRPSFDPARHLIVAEPSAGVFRA